MKEIFLDNKQQTLRESSETANEGFRSKSMPRRLLACNSTTGRRKGNAEKLGAEKKNKEINGSESFQVQKTTVLLKEIETSLKMA